MAMLVMMVVMMIMIMVVMVIVIMAKVAINVAMMKIYKAHVVNFQRSSV